MNENQKIKELEAEIKKSAEKISEMDKNIEEKSKIVESKEQEIVIIKESVERKDTINTLLKPLNKDKAGIMTDLLESVQTSKLKTAFDRYLPAVLDGKKIVKESKKSVINENRSVATGDKQPKPQAAEVKEEDSNIIEIRQLAGLK